MYKKHLIIRSTGNFQVFLIFFLILGHTLLSTLKIPGLEVFELEQQFNKW